MLVRNLPDDVHAELCRRARASGMSTRAYIAQVLGDHVASPSMAEWLADLRAMPPIAGAGTTGAELVAAARADDDELLGR